MIDVAWSPEAAEDLENILTYIAKNSREAAGLVAARIRESEQAIALFPRAARQDPASGSWERPVPGLPLLFVYVIANECVRIVALFHTAQAPEHKRTIH